MISIPKPNVSGRVAVILTDKDRRILWVNDDFTAITGYELIEVLGKKPSVLQGKETESDVIQRLRDGLEREVSVKETVTNYRKNGESYTCVLVIHPVFNDEHQLTNYIAFEVDASVTNEKAVSLLQVRDKYSSSSLNIVQEKRMYQELVQLMKIEKLYLRPDIRLEDLADLMETNSRYLSQVVNGQTGKNFQAFVNSFRIDEAKKKLLDPNLRHITTFAIAQMSGFNSRSTFYKAFQEIVGYTPKDFVREFRRLK